MSGRPSNLINIVGQGPAILEAGAKYGLFGIMPIFSFFSFSFWDG